MKIVDIHSHLHSSFFKDDKEKIIEKMKEKDYWTISVGVDKKDSQKAVELARKHFNIYATIGIHPIDGIKEKFDENFFEELLKSSNKIVGIGECGLDYYWPKKDLEAGKIDEVNFARQIQTQKEEFKKQIDFALKHNLPLMLHIRSYQDGDAHWDAFKILKEKEKEWNQKIKANFHFFTEGPKVVEEIIKNQWMISLPGVITFANLDESIKKIPLENLMIETDSPFATPKPYRGKINNPFYVIEVAKKIAEIKRINLDEVIKSTTQNAINFWNLKY